MITQIRREKYKIVHSPFQRKICESQVLEEDFDTIMNVFDINLKKQNLSKWKIIFVFFCLMQFVNGQQNSDQKRSFTFLEQYHFPVTQRTCEQYSESEMLKNGTDFTINMFFERFIIYSAIKKVVGENVQISFQCVEDIEGDNTDDPKNLYAGKFGNLLDFYLEDDDYYISIPTLHFENFYVQKKHLKKIASQNVFEYLNYLFYLGIFLIPALTGLILLLFKDLTTIYDYQRVVYSVLRYLNRQGDQQLSQWTQKSLSLTIAIFFFLHYAVLLGEMTALRRFSFQTEDVNRDSYRDIQNSNDNVDETLSKYYFLNCDSYQYHFLKYSYEMNEDFIDSSINHYNVQLSKHHFKEPEYQRINKEILRFSAQLMSNNSIIYKDKFNAKSDDIYINWIILGAAVFGAIIFKLLQLRFQSLNSYTEIQSYRDQVNQIISLDFSEMFRQIICQFFDNIQAKDHVQNFKKVNVNKKFILLGRQVYRLIEKRRKKIKFHRKKRNQNNNDIQILKIKNNLYLVIKGYLDSEKKGKVDLQGRSTDSRRYAIQANMNQQQYQQNPQNSTNDTQQTDKKPQFLRQITNKNGAHVKDYTKEMPNSFNSLKVKNREPSQSVSSKVNINQTKIVGQSKFARRLSQLAFSTDLHESDSPKQVNRNKAISSPKSPYKNKNLKQSSPTHLNQKNKNGSQQLQISSLFIQDTSSNARRRGTSNILNPIQLLSLRKYDEQLTRKHNLRNASINGKKSKSLTFQKRTFVEFDLNQNTQNQPSQNQNQNTENKIQDSQIQFYDKCQDIERLGLDSDNLYSNGNDQNKVKNNNISKNNKINQQNDIQYFNHIPNQRKQSSDQKVVVIEFFNTKNSEQSEMNTFRDSNLSKQNLLHSKLNTNGNFETKQSESEIKTFNRFVDSARNELLQTEDYDEAKYSMNFNDHQTNTASKFIRTSPFIKNSSDYHNIHKENLFTEDDLLGENNENHIVKLQQLESIQSEYVKTPPQKK